MKEKILRWFDDLIGLKYFDPYGTKKREREALIENIKRDAIAVFRVEYDVSCGPKGEIILTPRVVRLK